MLISESSDFRPPTSVLNMVLLRLWDFVRMPAGLKMRRLFLLLVLYSPLILNAVLARSQQLTVQDETGKQTVLTTDDLQDLPHFTISTGASGTSAVFEGMALKTVL
jgi:hypothetical protein